MFSDYADGWKSLVSDGKQYPSSLLGNTDNLLESFDASVNISRSMAPLPSWSGELQPPFFFKSYIMINCRACEITCIVFTEKKYWSCKKWKNTPIWNSIINIVRASCKVKWNKLETWSYRTGQIVQCWCRVCISEVYVEFSHFSFTSMMRKITQLQKNGQQCLYVFSLLLNIQVKVWLSGKVLG